MSAIRSLVRGIISGGTPAPSAPPPLSSQHSCKPSLQLQPHFTLLCWRLLLSSLAHVEVLAECVMPRWRSPGGRGVRRSPGRRRDLYSLETLKVSHQLGRGVPLSHCPSPATGVSSSPGPKKVSMNPELVLMTCDHCLQTGTLSSSVQC